MSLLLESIRLEDGKFENLPRHQRRMLQSLVALGCSRAIDLEAILSSTHVPFAGLYKCRVVYDGQSSEVAFHPYERKDVASLRLVESDSLQYELKFCDRTQIDRLFTLRKDCDDILIVKNGLVTDTSYANIAFRKNDTWYTPRSPILKGTYRQKLLEENMLIDREITPTDIHSFDSFKLLNAMWRFDGPELSVDNIIQQ